MTWLRLLQGKDYEVVHNLFLQTDRGSSQIDHLVVSAYGIFVIETKNYKGWIHGHENSAYWTQTIYKHKNQFRNLIIQCRGHIRALRSILQEFDWVAYYPIVVFSGQALLKNMYSDTPVIYSRQLLKTIKIKEEEKILSPDDIHSIIQALKAANIKVRSARRRHVRKANKNARRQKTQEKLSICPRCGGDLMLRDGKYG